MATEALDRLNSDGSPLLQASALLALAVTGTGHIARHLYPPQSMTPHAFSQVGKRLTPSGDNLTQDMVQP